MNRNIVLIGILIILVAVGAWWYTSQSEMYPFEIASEDNIQSWDFQGAYEGNADLEKRAHDEIDRLEGLVGSGEETDYILYVSIANQYNLLGDGENEYKYLRMALAEDSETTGLAWHNLGKLFERLGAYGSARIAYDGMVRAQPGLQYFNTRLEFLKTHYPNDTAAIAAAEADIKAVVGELIGEE